MQSSILTPRVTFAETFHMPELAPLSIPLVLHLIREKYDVIQKISNPIVHRRIQANIHQLAPLFVNFRGKAFYSILAAKKQEKFGIAFFQDTIDAALRPKTGTDYSRKPSNAALSAWKANNVLLPREPRQIDADSALAVWFCAAVDNRLQGFLPSMVLADEPRWWCYAQEAPIILPDGTSRPSAVFVCPVPPPPDLPSGTLLWTPYSTFAPQWLQLPGIGAIAWSDVRLVNGEVQWTVPRKILARWDKTLVDLDLGVILDTTLNAQNLHQLASTLLWSKAQKYLIKKEYA